MPSRGRGQLPPLTNKERQELAARLADVPRNVWLGSGKPLYPHLKIECDVHDGWFRLRVNCRHPNTTRTYLFPKEEEREPYRRWAKINPCGFSTCTDPDAPVVDRTTGSGHDRRPVRRSTYRYPHPG